MYKHILLPTDGSALSERAISSGVLLAKAIGARVTGLHVMPKVFTAPIDIWVHGGAKSQSRLRQLFEEQATEYLAFIEKAADVAAVPCRCIRVIAESPYEAILRAAQSKDCDLIFMASHGKKGTAAMVLGSETVKVLTHSRIPVVVHRESAAAVPRPTKRLRRPGGGRATR